MKKIMFLPIAAIIMAACGNSRPADSYVISGEIEGLPDSTVIVLTPFSHSPEESIAEATLLNGKFTFEGKGNDEEPLAVRVHVKDGYGGKIILLDNSDIKVKGNVELADSARSVYNFDNLTVSGSPSTDKYYSLMSRRDTLNAMYAAMHERFKDIYAKVGVARGSGNNEMLDSLKTTDEYKAQEAAEKEFFSKVEEVTMGLINENKDTYWGPLMMLSNFSYLSPEQIPTYESFSETAKNSIYGKQVFDQLFPAGKVGEEVKDFKVGDTSFAELCKGKKVVILDFWASWCRPCRAEIPNLKSIYDKHKDQGFDIVSISIDDDVAAWQKALDQEKLPWQNYRDADDAISKLYKVSAVPTMYIVDGDHKLLGNNLRGEELAKAIDTFMSE